LAARLEETLELGAARVVPSLNQVQLPQVLLRCSEWSWLAQSGCLADRLRLLVACPLGLEGRRSRLDQGRGDQCAEEEKPGEHVEAGLKAVGEGEGAGCLYLGVRVDVRAGGRGGDRADCGETDGTPIWRLVLTRPDATPESDGRTPARLPIVAETKETPKPRPPSRKAGKRSQK
jgi:hypothetical protein